MAVVERRDLIRLEDHVARKLGLEPGERLVVRVVGDKIIITRSKSGAYKDFPKEVVEEAIREVEEGEDMP